MEVNFVKNFFFQCAAEYAQDMFSGCVFTSICHSVHRGVYTPPPGRHPWADTPLGRHPSGQTPPIGRHPSGQTSLWADAPLGRDPQADTPLNPVGKHPLGRLPKDGQCSGWYASYWSAFLFFGILQFDPVILAENCMKKMDRRDASLMPPSKESMLTVKHRNGKGGNWSVKTSQKKVKQKVVSQFCLVLFSLPCCFSAVSKKYPFKTFQ